MARCNAVRRGTVHGAVCGAVRRAVPYGATATHDALHNALVQVQLGGFIFRVDFRAPCSRYIYIYIYRVPIGVRWRPHFDGLTGWKRDTVSLAVRTMLCQTQFDDWTVPLVSRPPRIH